MLIKFVKIVYETSQKHFFFEAYIIEFRDKNLNLPRLPLNILAATFPYKYEKSSSLKTNKFIHYVFYACGIVFMKCFRKNVSIKTKTKEIFTKNGFFFGLSTPLRICISLSSICCRFIFFQLECRISIS